MATADGLECLSPRMETLDVRIIGILEILMADRLFANGLGGT